MNQLNPIPQQKLKNQINEQSLEHPFTDYWDIFVLKHQNPINISLHILGIFVFYGLLFSAWKLQNFWLLLALPLAQITGLIGHFLFERSYVNLQDAVFSWRTSLCLGRMFFRTLIGKYGDDIRQRQEILRKYQSKDSTSV